MKRGFVFLMSIALIGIVALLAGDFTAFDFGRRSGGPPVNAAHANSPAGSSQKFEYLSQQQSNRCDLQSGTVLEYPDSMRLQGSCCSPMDMAEYQHQVDDLNKYASVEQIPQDPYDIPAAQAKQLLRYQRTIKLSPDEQVTYDTAMEMSREKGPCCCQCWRWYAFEGMSKYLIQERGWDSPKIASLIELVDGCGGSHAGQAHSAA